MGEMFKEEEVRAVFLADSETLYFPQDLSSSAPPAISIRASEDLPPSAGQTEKAGSRDAFPFTSNEVEQYLGGLTSGAVVSEPFKVRIDPELLDRFQLSVPKKSTFQLPIVPAQAGTREENWREAGESKIRNDLLIPFAAGSDSRLKKLLVSSRGYSASADKSSEEKARFNIHAWAERALAQIEKNWVLDPVIAGSLKAVVGISLILDRSGEIILLEVVKFSGSASLDQTALNALEASNPLPALSALFPDQTLVLYLEFAYGQ